MQGKSVKIAGVKDRGWSFPFLSIRGQFTHREYVSPSFVSRLISPKSRFHAGCQPHEQSKSQLATLIYRDCLAKTLSGHQIDEIFVNHNGTINFVD